MIQETQKPLILGIIPDPALISKIGPIIEGSGYSVLWFDRFEDVIENEDNNHIHSTSRMSVRHKDALIDTITTLLPALIIVEINHPNHVWHNCLVLLKSDPATRRIPILVYGLHIQAETLSLAAELGMDVALPGSKFIKQLSLIIKHHANIQDENVMLVCCQANLSEHARVGIERFNQEEYFLAHEYFEQAWIDDNSPGRDLHRALVQVAVVCYQIERGNYTGARKIFLHLRQWLAWVPDQCRGIDIAKFRADVKRIQTTFLVLGPEKLKEFVLNELPIIYYHS